MYIHCLAGHNAQSTGNVPVPLHAADLGGTLGNVSGSVPCVLCPVPQMRAYELEYHVPINKDF